MAHSCFLSHQSCRPLYHFFVRGRVNICVVVVALINIIAVLPIRGVICGIVGVISGSFLILKERVSVSVLNVEAPWIAAYKAIHAIDYVLWKGERSEYLSVQYQSCSEAHEEVRPLLVPGWS